MNPNPDELLSLEGAMRAPDAIMEPGMAEAVGQYIRAGGKPEDVIESLTTSYEGRQGRTRRLGAGCRRQLGEGFLLAWSMGVRGAARRGCLAKRRLTPA